jgi:lipoyl-dependent peroxiredoxin
VTHLDKVLYTAKTHTTGRRDRGASSTADLDIRFSTPGVSSGGANPEQLFAAGWSACLLSAINLVATRLKVDVPREASIDAEIDLGPVTGGAYGLAARLMVSLPGVDRSDAERLIEAAHEICPYSRAIRGNINVINLLS